MSGVRRLLPATATRCLEFKGEPPAGVPDHPIEVVGVHFVQEAVYLSEPLGLVRLGRCGHRGVRVHVMPHRLKCSL